MTERTARRRTWRNRRLVTAVGALVVGVGAVSVPMVLVGSAEASTAGTVNVEATLHFGPCGFAYKDMNVGAVSGVYTHFEGTASQCSDSSGKVEVVVGGACEGDGVAAWIQASASDGSGTTLTRTGTVCAHEGDKVTIHLGTYPKEDPLAFTLSYHLV